MKMLSITKHKIGMLLPTALVSIGHWKTNIDRFSILVICRLPFYKKDIIYKDILSKEATHGRIYPAFHFRWVGKQQTKGTFLKSICFTATDWERVKE